MKPMIRSQAISQMPSPVQSRRKGRRRHPSGRSTTGQAIGRAGTSSHAGVNLPKVRDAGLAVRIPCTRRDTARSAVLRACQGHSRRWSHFRFNQIPVGARGSVGLSCAGPQRERSAKELTSLRDVSEVHEFSKRRRSAVQFDVGGPGHSDVHGWHAVRQ